MTVTQAVVLGTLQGLTEFLPVSSSAHLVLAPWFLGWSDPGLGFDVALHMGTLLAVVTYFWRDWVGLARRAVFAPLSGEGKLFWLLMAATVPGAMAGLLLEEQAQTVFRFPFLVAVMLMVMGAALYLADAWASPDRTLDRVGWADGLVIGLAQAAAIIPGVSRSGITMAAARVRRLSREAAARFSFLLSTPIIFGAGVLELRHLSATDLDGAFWAGMVSAAVVGFLAIRFLLRYLVRHTFEVFVWYRFVLAFAVLVVLISRHSGG